MEGWQQDWLKSLEAVANEVGQFFQDFSRDMVEAADALLEFSEEMAEEVESTLAPKLDQFDDQIMEWFDPLLQAVLGFETAIDRAVEPVTNTVEPLINQHPVCVGCRHYHGQTYSGNLLICAMHPYGIVDGSDQCPDKELFSWSFPHLPSSHADDEF
jgi:uncharacterized protein CbrC (UPF0167 family)